MTDKFEGVCPTCGQTWHPPEVGAHSEAHAALKMALPYMEGMAAKLEVARNSPEVIHLHEQIVRVRMAIALSEARDTVTVSRSLAERTEAMFRSVDPEGGIAQEWKRCIPQRLRSEGK